MFSALIKLLDIQVYMHVVDTEVVRTQCALSCAMHAGCAAELSKDFTFANTGVDVDNFEHHVVFLQRFKVADTMHCPS